MKNEELKTGKGIYLPLVALLIVVGMAFAACSETEETSVYDNWQSRNEAYIDSIAALVGNRYIIEQADADAMELGQIYAIESRQSSTNETKQYIYCKKLVANLDGEVPNYSGWHSTVDAFYYGTLITGDSFDGNFEGYGAIDQEIPLPPVKVPTEFDSSSQMSVTGVVSGWTWVLQYMHVGERWMMYIPWQSAYGSSGNGSIPGYSALTFDMILDGVE